MNYESLAGKIIRRAVSSIEDGAANLELVFSDETTFTFQSACSPTIRARAFDADGELTRLWE
jgi:hypothetical protein